MNCVSRQMGLERLLIYRNAFIESGKMCLDLHAGKLNYGKEAAMA